MIDLTPFCSTHISVPKLMQPFSRGDFTWATNGHVMARVERRPGVPDGVNLNVEQFIRPAVMDVALPRFEELSAIADNCALCSGTGKTHDCPDCKCLCADCNGTGKDVLEYCVIINGVFFDYKYIRIIAALPNLMIELPEAMRSMRFSFDGGEGVLMPLCNQRGAILERAATVDGVK